MLPQRPEPMSRKAQKKQGPTPADKPPDLAEPEIAAGLSGDESDIKANAASLADGQPVQVVDPAGR